MDMKIELLLCNGGQKMAIFQFFLPPGKLIEVIFFSRAHQKNSMIFEHNLPKFHQNLKSFY